MQSVPELARRAGLPEDAFVKTIERYNTDAAAGGDTVFGAPASGQYRLSCASHQDDGISRSARCSAS